MTNPGKIKIEDYNYSLTDEKIARYPLPDRDSSKLLFYKGGSPEERSFGELPGLLPRKSLLLFNVTKVVNARLLFKKSTGAVIEIFCLEPIKPVVDFQLAFQQNSPVIWKCLVGNAKRWKSGKLELDIFIDGQKVTLTAERLINLRKVITLGLAGIQAIFLFRKLLAAPE